MCEMLLHGYELNSSSLDADSHPSTPSSSEEEGSSGWDTSSDEDIMEHASVSGSASFYGDDDRMARPYDQDMKKYSVGSFKLDNSNPEVERYIES